MDKKTKRKKDLANNGFFRCQWVGLSELPPSETTASAFSVKVIA
jgi:hypothetical protein